MMTLPNLKPEVDLRRHGRHLENRNDIITPVRIGRFVQNLVLMQDEILMMTKASESKSGIEFQYGGRFFPKPEAVISQPRIEITR